MTKQESKKAHNEYRRKIYLIQKVKETRQKNNLKWALKNKDKIALKNKNWYTKNKNEVLRKAKERFLKNPAADVDSRYKELGFSSKDFYKLFEKQGGVCAICKKQSNNRRLSVDHCHVRLKVRGLLCANCNRAIGMLKDDIENLKSAIKYLRKNI